MPDTKWAAFEQSGDGATEGMGITTLLGVGNLEPLGDEFPPPAGGSLGPLNETLEVPAIGDDTVRPAIVARSNATVLDAVGATVQFRQSEGAETASGDEIPVASEHFNASDETLSEDHYILGVNFAGDIPVAAFSGTPLSGAPPLSVTFTDESTNNPTSWLWEKSDDGGTNWVPFDGTPTAQNPVEDFGAGSWMVRLTASNPNGSDTHTSDPDYIVTVIAPVADFSGTPLTGNEPLSVTFTDLSTNTPTSWLWEKSDDGGANWVDFDGTPTAQNPVEDFDAGTWSVRLTATNLAGSDSETKSAYVVSVDPTLSIHRWDSGTKTAGVTLSNSNRTANNGASATYQGVKSTLNDLLVGGTRKLYGEFEVMATSAGNIYICFLQSSVVLSAGSFPLGFGGPNYCANHRNDGSTQLNYNDATGWHRTVNAASTAAWNTVGKKVMWAIDEATGNAWTGVDGVWSTGLGGGAGNPATGAFPTYTNMPAGISFSVLFQTDNNGGNNTMEIPVNYNGAWIPSGFSAM